MSYQCQHYRVNGDLPDPRDLPDPPDHRVKWDPPDHRVKRDPPDLPENAHVMEMKQVNSVTPRHKLVVEQ